MSEQDMAHGWHPESMEYRDFLAFQNILDKRYDERYVRREECDADMRNASETVLKMDARLTVLEQRVNINNWLSVAIAGGIITLVIKVFLGG